MTGRLEEAFLHDIALNRANAGILTQCHRPFGLQGVYSGTLSPNPLAPCHELIAGQVASHRARWSQFIDRAADCQTCNR